MFDNVYKITEEERMEAEICTKNCPHPSAPCKGECAFYYQELEKIRMEKKNENKKNINTCGR